MIVGKKPEKKAVREASLPVQPFLMHNERPVNVALLLTNLCYTFFKNTNPRVVRRSKLWNPKPVRRSAPKPSSSL